MDFDRIGSSIISGAVKKVVEDYVARMDDGVRKEIEEDIRAKLTEAVGKMPDWEFREAAQKIVRERVERAIRLARPNLDAEMQEAVSAAFERELSPEAIQERFRARVGEVANAAIYGAVAESLAAAGRELRRVR
jgi:hypothetical protein